MFKKIILSLLIAVVLFSSIGIQGVVHHCNGCCGDKSVVFWEENITLHACCSTEQGESKIPDIKTNLSQSECCTQNNFYFQLSIDAVLHEYKQTPVNILGQEVLCMNFPTTITCVDNSLSFLIPPPPLLEFSLANGKRLPVLYSQFTT